MFQPLTYAAEQPNYSGTIAWTDPPPAMVAAARTQIADRVGVLFDTDADRWGPLGFDEGDGP